MRDYIHDRDRLLAAIARGEETIAPIKQAREGRG